MSIAPCPNGEAPLREPPLIRRWSDADGALPRRIIRCHRQPRHHPLASLAPPWLDSGKENKPFDFCEHVKSLCADMVRRCSVLRHIDISRLLFAVTQARSSRSYGLQARVTPLRFRDGQLVRRRRGGTYQVQRYFVGEQEMLYVVTFCLPRFLDQDFDDKLITLFHELYHISPAFDGDLRRQQGRYAIHSRSKRGYDEQMADLARTYLGNGADPTAHAFLRLNFAQLQQRHGQVVGVVVPRPRLIPIRGRKKEMT